MKKVNRLTYNLKKYNRTLVRDLVRNFQYSVIITSYI